MLFCWFWGRFLYFVYMSFRYVVIISFCFIWTHSLHLKLISIWFWRRRWKVHIDGRRSTGDQKSLLELSAKVRLWDPLPHPQKKKNPVCSLQQHIFLFNTYSIVINAIWGTTVVNLRWKLVDLIFDKSTCQRDVMLANRWQLTVNLKCTTWVWFRFIS